ncbi:MAG: nucleotidyltransferase family protein [bacterium]
MIGSAELQVIQATLRVDEGRDASIRETAGKQLDWHKVQSLAQHHGVSPLVCKRLKEVAPDLVPPTAMQEMAAFQKANELRVIQMTADLIKVVRALEAEYIPVLCLKGPVLAQVLYGDPAMRLFGDLDILVKQCDYNHAEKVLHKLGLEPAINELFPTYETTEGIFALERERHFEFPHKQYVIELHWRITTREFPRALDIDGLFARSREVTVNGQMLRTISAEDQMIHACHHGSHHYWEKFSYIADSASALSLIDGARWDNIVATSQEQGLYRPLLVSLGLCHDLSGLVLSETLTASIVVTPLVQRIVYMAKSYICREVGHGADPLDKMMFILFLANKDRFYRITMFMRTMFTPTAPDFQWLSLPESVHWLYPVLRPFRRAGRGVSMLYARRKHR